MPAGDSAWGMHLEIDIAILAQQLHPLHDARWRTTVTEPISGSCPRCGSHRIEVEGELLGCWRQVKYNVLVPLMILGIIASIFNNKGSFVIALVVGGGFIVFLLSRVLPYWLSRRSGVKTTIWTCKDCSSDFERSAR